MGYTLMKDTRAYFTKEEVEKMLVLVKRISGNRDYFLFKLLWETGARITEILYLRFGDIDFSRQLVRLITLKRHYKNIEKIYKHDLNKLPDVNKYPYRNVPITKKTCEELLEYKTKIKANDNNRVINLTYDGAYNVFKSLKYSFYVNNILEKNRLYLVHPHTLRHSFAINYILKGGNVVNLQRILGHSSLDTTTIYLNIAGVDLKKEYDNIMNG
jgi:integrase/recombinase XerD